MKKAGSPTSKGSGLQLSVARKENSMASNDAKLVWLTVGATLLGVAYVLALIWSTWVLVDHLREGDAAGAALVAGGLGLNIGYSIGRLRKRSKR